MAHVHRIALVFVTLLCGCGSSSTRSAPPPPAATTAPSCGDEICSDTETCSSCAEDCGACAACSAAPSCTDALGVPATPAHRYDLDVNPASSPDLGGATPPVAGAADCGKPQLRLRVAKMSVQKGGGEVYCIVAASDGTRSEVALTTKTRSLGDNEASYFDPSVGVFWGQKELTATTDNLTLTFDCFKVGSDAWAQALQALSDSAQQAGGIAGPYGWAFGVGAAAAAAAAAAAKAASGDDHRFNVQQTLDRKTLLDLTNGRAWDVRQTGSCGLFCSWDWTLTIESWGCATATSPTR